jgi:hypothetical protein
VLWRSGGGVTLMHMAPLLFGGGGLSAPFVCVQALSVPRVVVDICSERVVLRVRLFSA